MVVRQIDSPDYDAVVFTNGINNSLDEALVNGAMQSGKESFILNYNPTHGIVGDLLESVWDAVLGGVVRSGSARNTSEFLQQGIDAGIVLSPYGHSQGGLITWRAIEGLDFAGGKNPEVGSIQLSGAPVDAVKFHEDAMKAGFEKELNHVFQINRPDEKIIGIFPKTDTVSDLVGLNMRYSEDPVARTIGAILSFGTLFGENSPHSNYLCQTAACKDTSSDLNTQFKNGRKYITPTLIDAEGVSHKVILP